MVLDERDRIEQNHRTIRDYLIHGFPGFQLTEDAPDPTICHRFTMTDVKTFEQYKLKVGCRASPRLPTIQKRRTVHWWMKKWIAKMRRAKGHYLYW